MNLSRSYIRAPKRLEYSASQKVLHAVFGMCLAPVFWLLAAIRGAPGMRYRAKCLMLALKLLFAPKAHMPAQHALRLIYMPMDSTRYFEFDFVDRSLANYRVERLLDVSSPRLVPVMMARDRSSMRADLLNPDAKDMDITRELVNAAGLADRCRLQARPIEEASFEPESFDAVTCISVLEHIPGDVAAVRTMWSLVKPGGVLLLTLPCMSQACEQYIDYDEYGLLEADEAGFVFWQRFYDAHLLEERIFSIVGRPVKSAVYGEKVRGSFFRNAQLKRKGAGYPFWREPYMMATEYGYFDDINQLPGDGVVGLVFVKQ